MPSSRAISALLPSSGCASSARWYAASVMPASRSVFSRRRMASSITRESLSQSTPWWTRSIWAPAAAVRSKSSSDDETPHAIRSTSGAPATCMPMGP